MRPFIKTWLTLCLLLPLAAHATTREQKSPSSVSAQTTRTEAKPSTSKTEKPQAKQSRNEPGNKPRQQTTTAAVEPRDKKRTSSRVADNSKKTKASSAKVSSAKVSKTASSSKTKSSKTVTSSKTAKSSKSVKGQPATAQAPKQSSLVVERAVTALGTPYRWGGTNPKKGFDCSGFVKYAFNDVKAVNLPRTSSEMAAGHGVKVERKDLKPGDLLFFNTRGRQVNHVAIYLGGDRFIHAPSAGKAVTIDSLDKPYWNEHYVVAKRVLKSQQPNLRLASNDLHTHTR